MALLTYKPALRALDSQGAPVPGAVRYIFSAASERPSTAYSDSHLTYSQPSQQKADDGGWFGRCFLPTGKYRIRIEDRFGTTLLDDDGVAVGSSVTDTLQDLQTAFDLLSDQQLCYHEMNGREAVTVGQQVRTADAALAYLVAPADAVDHHLATAGGVKLYALPDRRGEVSTKQLGWQDGADITQALTRLLADAPADIRILRFDGSYRLRGGEYVIPDTMVGWYSDDYERLNHGEEATRSLMMMDAVPATAEANGLPVNLKRVFLAPSGFTVGGLRLAHDRPVDARTLVSGSNKGAFFFCGNRARGLSIDKCRFDFEGGIGIDIQASPSWRFTRNHAGPQKYLLFVNGASDFGLYEGNAGQMGFVGLKINGVDSQIFGDYIKTAPLARRGPRFCTVRDNRFINDTRDGPDGTGGFYGWLFEGNYFEVGFAGIDIKTSFRNASDLGYFTRDYCGVVIRNNVFVGCGIVYTTSWSESGVGLPYDEDWAVRDIVCDGNIYWPRLGKNTVAHYSKSTHRITSQNEIFRSWEGTPAGDWDASTGSFPSGAVANSFYTVSVAGTVDGISFGVNQSVYARIDDAATDTYAGNWFRTPNGHSRIGIQMLKVDDNSAAGILPRNIQMRGIRWDARGSPTMQLNECRDVALQFDELLLDGTSYVQIGGTNIQITGTVRALDKPAHMVGDSDVFGLAGARNVRFDLECHHEGTQTRGALVMVQANSHDIWIDGRCENLAELVVAWGATIDGLHLGKRSGLRLSGVGTILAGAGVNRNVFSGALETGGAGLFQTMPENHDLGRLNTGSGPVAVLNGTTLTLSHAYHRIDTQAQTTTGDLEMLVGGHPGDRLVLRALHADRAVVAKAGIGNLILPEDRALSDPEATLIVEKRGTDWYEVSFSPA